MNELHIGLDDTDSQMGMCTTFVANRVIEEIGLDDELTGYPELIRLNPTIPWKTRGNGALCIRLLVDETERDLEFLKKKVIEVVDDYREGSSNTGVVFFEEDPREIEEISCFSKRAIKEVVSIQSARELANEFGEVKEFGNGQGVVGALSACGYVFSDYTYEFIGYRREDKWGKNREIDLESVKAVSEEYYPVIWDNFDWKNDEAVLAPNTPCPVLFGLRGDDAEVVKEASSKIDSEEVVSFSVFRSNQGTDEHLVHKNEIKEIKPYTSVIASGKVDSEPKTMEGGHVFFSLRDEDGKIDCGAYEPTKGFRNIIRELIPGDRVRVYGGVRKKPLTINLEKIKVLNLNKDVFEKNPVCPSCGNRMKSAGKNQGFRCRDCKIFSETKTTFFRKRNLGKTTYEVPPTARRHLSKPLVRENKDYRD